jgi:hypothetical protein
MNTLEFLSVLIENPKSKKAYKDFKVYLESQGMTHEAAAMQSLIEQRFGNDHRPDIDEE